MEKPEEATVCPYCDFRSNTERNLKKHVDNMHRRDEPRPEPKHRCDQCHMMFFTLNEMKSHYASDHDYRPVYEEHCFATMSAFHSWKEKVENDTRNNFVVSTGVKRNSAGEKVHYFHCRRSGKYTPRGAGKRQLKTQGSVKCGRQCFAMITATESKRGVHVVFQRTHLNHDSNLAHVLLSNSERAAIAGKLQEGVGLEAVLDGVRESLDGTLKRIHLLTKQDLYNITRDYKINSSERLHKDDYTSVLLWVKQMQAQKDNPVLFFKNQGQADTVNHLGRQACDLLEDNDFMLAIMTAPQQELLQKLGTDRICVDGTHGTTGFDFQLVTVLCVDEFGVGFPVAYCITSRIDQKAMNTFFRSIKDKTGRIQATSFMSDDAPAFYNAWQEVMGDAVHRLLCAWHIDKNLREGIRKHVADKELQAFTYKALRMVIDAPTEERFEFLLSAFLAWCDLEGEKEEGLLKFKEYFLKYYAKRPKVWAACFRKEAGINTNMRLEALHRVIKYCYLEGKRNKRVDKLISVLMKLTRNKIFDRLIKLVKNAESEFDQGTRTRHNAGAQIPQDHIKQAGIGQWTVKSQSSPTIYVVTEHKKGVCQVSCALTCKACKVCIHNVTCCCPDNELRRHMCKHIHAVFCDLADSPNDDTADAEPNVQGSFNNHTEDHLVQCLTSLHTLKNKGTAARPESCLPMVDAIREHLQNPAIDQQAVPWLTPILQDVIDKLASSAAPLHLPPNDVSYNSKIERQIRFSSTKHKPDTLKAACMGKPSQIEQGCIFEVLTAATGSTSASHTAFDHVYETKSKE